MNVFSANFQYQKLIVQFFSLTLKLLFLFIESLHLLYLKFMLEFKFNFTKCLYISIFFKQNNRIVFFAMKLQVNLVIYFNFFMLIFYKVMLFFSIDYNDLIFISNYLLFHCLNRLFSSYSIFLTQKILAELLKILRIGLARHLDYFENLYRF